MDIGYWQPRIPLFQLNTFSILFFVFFSLASHRTTLYIWFVLCKHFIILCHIEIHVNVKMVFGLFPVLYYGYGVMVMVTGTMRHWNCVHAIAISMRLEHKYVRMPTVLVHIFYRKIYAAVLSPRKKRMKKKMKIKSIPSPALPFMIMLKSNI